MFRHLLQGSQASEEGREEGRVVVDEGIMDGFADCTLENGRPAFSDGFAEAFICELV